MLRKLLFISALIFVPQNRPVFEVASIKPREFKPGLLGIDYQAGGRLVATQAPLDMLIWSAYAILPPQLEFAPGVEPSKDMYDIEARPGPNAIPPGRLSRDSVRKMELMLQS